MYILLTNDDGINAPGIQTLRKVLESVARLVVVAPNREQSATGHAITIHRPLTVDRVSFHGSSTPGWVVDGTPADCVKVALDVLCEERPDMVVSGINWGANLGTDVLYSGTVSAAIEGIMAGIPAVAASLVTGKRESDYQAAARVTKRVCMLLAKKSIPGDTLLNVNIPDVPVDEMGRIEVTTLAKRRYINTLDRRVNPRGREYYWLTGELVAEKPLPGTDVAVLARKGISVSPVHFDLTNYRILEDVTSWDWDVVRGAI